MSAPEYVKSGFNRLLSVCLVGLLATASLAQSPAPAQTAQDVNPPLTPLPQAPAPQRNAHLYSDQDYSRAKRQWPNPFTVYAVRGVAPLNVTNSGRIDQVLKDGKMYLSLNDAIALALPEQIICRDDCAGLCSECGKNLNDEPHTHEAQHGDPRWGALDALRDEL